jgi:NAD(P)-dependent dehydrogenase (short-subunit alcohol dehydrogenase family)
MNMIVTGGNRGLGLHLVNQFSARDISRTSGFDITKNIKDIVDVSMQYDVFVNNAFDGPPQEDWANFGQAQVYFAVYDAWQAANKPGYIFNIGSVGEKTIVVPEPRFETYRVAKAALKHASLQGTQAFKQNVVPFRTTLITLDRLDTELTRSRANWTGNGHALDDVCGMIQLCMNTKPNTCVEEISAWVNFGYTV